ncbi:hypothetical protein CN980_21485 [Bacillus cereus]|uniref:Transposase n=1 Tax=Bacillus cereus TaxID=1396 RepID=A0A9X7C8P0_BACCE|nr:transposase [Bacillus thuringiensis serovar yunnanensis]PGO69406.1 hypothetical protein CN980_21485 [Bacillus cereus]
MGYFKGKKFKRDIILVAVGYYYRFSLSYRDVSEVLRRIVKSAGFQSLRHASRTIKGIETIHALYKQKRSLQQPNFVFPTYNELQQLFRIS